MATCTGSVLDSAVMTTNERCCMAASSSAVAPTCVAAPMAVQASMDALSAGKGSPVTSSATSKNSRPNGSP